MLRVIRYISFFGLFFLIGCGGSGGGSPVGDSSSGGSSSGLSSVSGASPGATNHVPFFTSTDVTSVSEGTSVVPIQVVALGADGASIKYTISGGADGLLFKINPGTGVIEFLTAPDYENPKDFGRDNVYDMEITTYENNSTSITQNFKVSVTDVPGRITSLTKDNILFAGKTVVARSTCEECDASLTKYKWYLASSDTAISESNTLSLDNSYQGEDVILEATPVSSLNKNGAPKRIKIRHNPVVDLHFAYNTLVAVKKDREVFMLGDPYCTSLGRPKHLPDYVQLTSVGCMFVAVLTNGTVLTWDDTYLRYQGYLLKNIVSVTAGDSSFAALTNDGRIIFVGSTPQGSPYIGENDYSDVELAISNDSGAIVMLKKDHSMIAVGDPEAGGDFSRFGIADTSHIKKIVRVHGGFSALREDGTALVWGRVLSPPNSAPSLTNIKEIVSNFDAVLALKNDGSLLSWGNPDCGVKADGMIFPSVKEIVAARCGFGVLNSDATAQFWTLGSGGEMRTHLFTNVDRIVGLKNSFIIVYLDGSVEILEHYYGIRKIIAGVNAHTSGQLIWNQSILMTGANVFDWKNTASDVIAFLQDNGDAVTLKTDELDNPTKHPIKLLHGVRKFFIDDSLIAASMKDGTVDFLYEKNPYPAAVEPDEIVEQ